MRLKTKLVLAISGMVVALVAIFSYFYVSRLVRQRMYEAYDSADFVAKEIRESARAASQAEWAARLPMKTIRSRSRQCWNRSSSSDKGLNTLLQSVVGYSPTISDAAIADVNGRAIVHTDPNAIGTNLNLEQRRDFQEVRNGSFLQQLKVVFGEPRVYDIYLPIQREGHPFGDIRVGISTVFLERKCSPSCAALCIFRFSRSWSRWHWPPACRTLHCVRWKRLDDGWIK